MARCKKYPEEDWVPRTLFLDVKLDRCPEKTAEAEQGEPEESEVDSTAAHFKIIEAIRHYRMVLRQLFSLRVVVEAAGGQMIVDPDGRTRVSFTGERASRTLEQLLATDVLVVKKPAKPASKKPKKASTKTTAKKPAETMKILAFRMEEHEDCYSYEDRGVRKKVAKSEVVSVEPKLGGVFSYEMRGYTLHSMAPTWKSVVWDQARRDLEHYWFKALDPVSGNSKGLAVLLMSRGIAEFDRVGLPVLRSVDVKQHVTINNRKIMLDWDHTLGPIHFYVKPGRGKKGEAGRRGKKLDPSRSYVLKMITDGTWPASTVRLSERDGKMTMLIPYMRPKEKSSAADANRTLIVSTTTDPENFFDLRIDAPGEHLVDKIRNEQFPVWPVVRQLHRYRAYAERIKQERRGCGTKYERKMGDGHSKALKSIIKRSEKLSKKRKNYSKTWNHLWTNRIAKFAVRWNCKNVFLEKLPQGNRPGVAGDEVPSVAFGMLGQPWNWSHFKMELKSKCELHDLLFKTPNEEKKQATVEVECCELAAVAGA